MPPSIFLSSTSNLALTSNGALSFAALPGAAESAVLQTFTVTNTNTGGTSQGFVQIPIHFAKGDCPSGSIPKVELTGGGLEMTAIQFTARATWTDGSLKRCISRYRTTTFAASAARTYDVRVKTGSYNDTPVFSTSDISAASDFKLILTNVLKADEYDSASPTYDTIISSATVTVTITTHGRSVGDRLVIWDVGSTGGLSMKGKLFTVATVPTADTFTFTHPDGNATSTATEGDASRIIWFPSTDLNDHEAVFNDGLSANINLDTIEPGPIATTFTMTQKVKDSVSTSLDPNLWVRWYLTAWDDGGGTINGNLEYVAVPLNITYDIAGRAEMNYTAELKDGATSKETYVDIGHLANGSWITCRMDDDDEHAKPHWQTTSKLPTLIVKHDADYMQRAEIVPPYPLIGASIPAYSTQTYAPFSNLGYRADTDSGGAYTGRGPMNPQDITCLLKADAISWRRARTDAFHALHYPIHYREAASDTIMSLKMAPMTPASSYDFTADGLEAPRDAYWGGSLDGYVSPTTSLGYWDVGRGRDGIVNSSHQMDPSYGMWLLTGYRYYLDASMGFVQKSFQQDTSSTSKLINAQTSSRQIAWSIPTTLYNAHIANMTTLNHRYIGWNALALGHVAGTIPDDDKHVNYFKTLNEHNGDALSATIATLPTAWSDMGHFIGNDNSARNGPRYFFDLMNAISFRYNSMLTEDPGFLEAAELYTIYVKNKFDMNHAAWASYNSGERTKLDDLDPATSTPFGTTDMFANIVSATITSDIVSATCPGGNNWTTNDKVIFLNYDGEKSAETIAPEAPAGVIKHVINPTAGTSFQLSDTPGGAAINFASDHTDMSVQVQWQDETSVASSIDGDSYTGMASMIMRIAHNIGSINVDQTLATEVNTYTSNEDYTAGEDKLHYAARDYT